jgi:hypothetical protein
MRKSYADARFSTVDDLVKLRRLGQTDLTVRPSSSGGHATKTDVPDTFDYAHLRVPLPADLKTSGIFTPLKNGQYPESYFLMVRDHDKMRAL